MDEDEALGELLTKHFETIEAKFGPLPDQIKGALARLDEMEQKAARRGSVGITALPTAGKQFVESEALKGFDSTQRGRAAFEVKAIISALTTDADGSAGDLIVPYRDNVVGLPRRNLVVRDLLTVVQIGSNSVQWPQVMTSTNNSATVSETSGATKPQSEIKIDLKTTNVTTIAHWVLATRQILDDAPQLMGLIDGELLYGLAKTEDAQLLLGGGTGSDLNGINTQATAYSAPIVLSGAGNLTKIDVIGMALLQQSLTNLPPDGIILHPADWLDMRLTKTDDGAYLLGDPQATIEPRLFGQPVVLTEAMTADNFMVGGFKQGATLYDRMAARVEVSTEDSDNFRKNLVTVLAEERVALAVKKAEAFTKGTFTAALAA